MEDPINPLQLHVRGVWKYRWIAIGITWLVAAVGWTKVAFMPNDYQSAARVFVDTQSILEPLMDGMTSAPNVEQQAYILRRTLLSRPNIARLMRMVDPGERSISPRQHENMLDNLTAAIDISGTNSNNVYTISYRKHDPKQVRDVVQSLLTILVEDSLKGKQGDPVTTARLVDEPIKDYEKRLIAAEHTLNDVKLRNAGQRSRQENSYTAHLQQQSNAVPEVESQLTQLDHDDEVNKASHETLIARREAAELSGERNSTTEPTFKIIDPPLLPSAPIGPNRPFLYSIVLLAALVAGIVTALLISQARPAFSGPDQIRDLTGLNVLGSVSMNWTIAEKRKRQRALYTFGMAFASLLCTFGIVLASGLIVR